MELGERRCRILTAVVHDYVQTAEPVGSETLVQRYDFGVKPATIRNELAAMSDLGYLHQPHTSAGRVPSDQGYRYYVDRLMPLPFLQPDESRQVKHSYDPYESEVEDILQQTCRILSNLTRYTSLATPPQMDTVRITHVALSAVGVGRLLVVTVLNTGHIDHRVLDCQMSLTDTDLVTMGNFINERFRDVDINGFALSIGGEIPADLQRLGWLYKKIASVLKQALISASDDDIYVEGTSHILKQPEFSHQSSLTTILEALEHRRALFQVMSRAFLGRDVTVIIGAENQLSEMQECSFVASSYSVGDKVCGSIGVIGPTRMDYGRAVAAVQFMASNLSELLTSLSIG